MKAVVLAAGRGTRLGGLTADVPKPMLEVRGCPVIGHTLSLLRRIGVEEVFINLHQNPEAIWNFFGDGSGWGLRIVYAYEPSLRGTAGALRNFAVHLTDEPFWVVYGDNYLDCSIRPLYDFHQENGGVATIALFEREDVRGAGVVRLDSRGAVLEFVEKPPLREAAPGLVNGGVYVVSPSIFSFIPEVGSSDFGFDVFPRVIRAGAKMYGRVLEGSSSPIDTPDLYRRLKEQVENVRQS